MPLWPDASPDGLVGMQANGTTFRARRAGAANEGPGLILLHGRWPRCSRTSRERMGPRRPTPERPLDL